MGRSPSFCFSFKACSGDADDDDFSTLQEIKASPDKRRWGFRKKSFGHHVPSNTVISEPLPIFSENQNQEATSDAFYASSDSLNASIVEQISPTLQLASSVVSSSVPKEFTSTSTVLVDCNIPEHDVIVIQTSIRRCLAQEELQKLKNVVKLQAVARGYLVRRQAAGTLRCIQAIVKMQALIRARRSVQSAKLTEKNNLDEYVPADVVKLYDMELKSSAIRKLVSSPYARQLLESTPKTRPIHISCDPLRPDSAWNWLERWMVLTSMDQQKRFLNQDGQVEDVMTDLASYNVDVGLHAIPGYASSDSEFAANFSGVPEVERGIKTNSYRRVELLAPAFVSDQRPNSPVQDNELQSRVQEAVGMEDKYWSKRGLEGSDYISSQMQQPSNVSLNFEHDGSPSKSDYTEDNFKNSARKELRETPEIGEKVVNGSRKSKNTAFTAVQTKFEELSSVPGSNRYFDYASRDIRVSKSAHSQVDFTSKEVSEKISVSSKVDNKLKDVNMNEKLSSHNPEGQGAASGHGAEISVSSRDRPEAALAEIIPKVRTLDDINHGVKSVFSGSLKFEEIEAETNYYLSKLDAVQTQRKVDSSKNAAISVAAVEAVQVEQQPADTTISSMLIQEEDAEDTYVDRPLPDGSPRNHTTAADSPVVPSSQIPLHVRTSKADNNTPSRKKWSQLAVKNSPTHSKNDSDARNSAEHLRKGTKNVKRPNSSGTDRTNHVDHEDRSSSNSLPGYMQPTESAKAKVNTSFSKNSSIGLHHKDNHIKKRHSLPIGNEKQGFSPRIQSSASQTPEDLKGNGVSSHNSTGSHQAPSLGFSPISDDVLHQANILHYKL